ncbi:hypothetical protein [uncultured Jatrophihabitans sp.]|uniref:hypothetical protein n=1 Tax=uncultured Jatrophihabitans sp. TaxID=1610747 RepID=UPI0035CC89A0
MIVSVGLNYTFTVVGAVDLDAESDQLMDELLKLEGTTLTDSAVSADLAASEVALEIVGHGDTFEEAWARANAAIRSAIHAVGGYTPNWEALQTSQHAELVS